MEIAKTALLGHPNLKAYYKLEDTTDSSGNGNTLTNHGTTPFNAGLFGNAADLGLGNVSKYLTIASNLGVDGGNITMSCWVKMEAEIGNGSWFLLEQVSATSKIAFYIKYDYNAGSRQITFVRDYNAGADSGSYQISLGSSNSWYHLALTYDGTTVRGYINGVLVVSFSSTTVGSGTVLSSAFAIGATTAGGNFTNGLVDDVGVWAAALPPQQIVEIYNTDATTLGLNNTHSLRLYSSKSEYISITDNANLKPTGNFTIEAWIKMPVGGASQGIFQSNSQNTNVAGVVMGVNNSNQLFLQSGKNTGVTGGTDYQSIASSITLNDNQWHHVAGVYDGAHLTIYIDGVQAGQIAWTNGAAYAATNYVRIGTQNQTGSNFGFLDAYVNDVRLFNGTAKTQAQIQADMVNSTLLLTTNLVARWLFNSSSGTIATDSINALNGTLNGYTSGYEGWTGDVPYPGNQINLASLALASTNSEALQLTTVSSLEPTGNFTIEAWIKTQTQNTAIFQSYSRNSNFAGIALEVSGQNLYLESGNNTGTTKGTNYQNVQGAVNICDGQWHHVAGVYDGTKLYVYVDGVLDNSVAWTTNPAYAATGYVRIGCLNLAGSNSTFFNGQLQNLRLWNVARTAAQILANMKANVIGTTGLITELRTQNQGDDQTAFVSGGNSSANNVSTYTNNPVFTTDVPFASYGQQYTQTLSDSIIHADTLTKMTGKVLSDIVTSTDVLNRFINKIISETVTHTDIFLKNFNLSLSLDESFSLGDMIWRRFARAIGSFTKHSSDSATFTEHTSTDTTYTKKRMG